MENNRLHARLECNRQCQLQWQGSTYRATITNMSIIAMGLHFDGSLPDVKIGDDCVIYLSDYKKTYPYELKYLVVRINASDIAVGIVDMPEH